MANQLLPLSIVDRSAWLVNITGNIQAQGLKLPTVEISQLELAIKVRPRHAYVPIKLIIKLTFLSRVRAQDCTRSGLDDAETVFSVINAFDIPKCIYNSEKKKYEFDSANRSFFPPAKYKGEYMKDR